MNAGSRLLIISRDALLEAEGQRHADTVFRQLASLSRQGYQLCLTAPEPEKWVPTRGRVDDALSRQSHLKERIKAAGGELDGVYYVPRSLLTQDRNREGALQDILARYGTSPNQATLISSSVPFLRAASRLGIGTREVIAAGDGQSNLLPELKNLALT